MAKDTLRETTVNPECEWEARHYYDALLVLRNNWGLAADCLGKELSKVPTILKAVCDGTKTEIAGIEGISPEHKRDYSNHLDAIKADIPNVVTERNRNQYVIATIQAMRDIAENGIMFDLLDQFAKCNCQGKGPAKF